jgi:hypothetical protein
MAADPILGNECYRAGANWRNRFPFRQNPESGMLFQMGFIERIF